MGRDDRDGSAVDVDDRLDRDRIGHELAAHDRVRGQQAHPEDAVHRDELAVRVAGSQVRIALDGRRVSGPELLECHDIDVEAAKTVDGCRPRSGPELEVPGHDPELARGIGGTGRRHRHPLATEAHGRDHGQHDQREAQRSRGAMERERDEDHPGERQVHDQDRGQGERAVTWLDHGQSDEEHRDHGRIDGSQRQQAADHGPSTSVKDTVVGSTFCANSSKRPRPIPASRQAPARSVSSVTERPSSTGSTRIRTR